MQKKKNDFVLGRIRAAQTVWRHIRVLNTHVLGPTQSDRLRRESSKNSLITTRSKKKKEKKKLQREAGLQFRPEGSFVRRKKRRGWPLVLLAASVSYRKAKRWLAVRFMRESVGNVSKHYANFCLHKPNAKTWIILRFQSWVCWESNKPEVITVDRGTVNSPTANLLWRTSHIVLKVKFTIEHPQKDWCLKY